MHFDGRGWPHHAAIFSSLKRAIVFTTLSLALSIGLSSPVADTAARSNRIATAGRTRPGTRARRGDVTA
ncbi:hypothetical protein CN645_11465 [Burkholderia sp. IDO3]|nr:hypothetical protein CN645_11465 [Burkholderia sp. IDO3]